MDVKKLKKAFQEIIDQIGLSDEKTGDPIAIPAKASEEYLTDKIKDALQYIEPEDKFSKDTQAIIDELNVPAEKPAKGKKGKKVVEPEPDPEDEEEEDEEVENTLAQEIEDAETTKELKAIAKANADKFADVDLKIKDIDELRDEMLAAIEEEDEEEVEVEEEEEEEEEETKPAPSKKAQKAVKKVAIEGDEEDEEDEEEEKPAKKSNKKEAPAPAKKPIAKDGQLESFQSIADGLLKEKATEKTILSTFAKLYKDRKGLTDPDFIKKRAQIYMDIAKKKK